MDRQTKTFGYLVLAIAIGGTLANGITTLLTVKEARANSQLASIAMHEARGIATSLTMADIINTVDGPLASEPARKSGTTSTTPIDVSQADPSDTTNTKATILVRVVNKHATNGLCLGSVAWATTCASSGITCSAHPTTDGAYVLPVSSLTRTFDGSRRPCIVASGASTTYQAEYIRREASR